MCIRDSITGVDATKSGILGLRWFDRKRKEGNLRNYVGRTNVHMNDDLVDSVKNVFELSTPFYTASINTLSLIHILTTDKNEMILFMREFSFATIITAKNNFPIATHLPFLVTIRDEKVILTSHFAKANEQWKDLSLIHI